MTQVLKKHTLLEGFSGITSFGSSLVLYGVEERVLIVDKEFQVQHTMNVDLGVISCAVADNGRIIRNRAHWTGRKRQDIRGAGQAPA